MRPSYQLLLSFSTFPMRHPVYGPCSEWGYDAISAPSTPLIDDAVSAVGSLAIEGVTGLYASTGCSKMEY